MKQNTPIIGISDFARGRHTPTSGRSYFDGSAAELVSLIVSNWDRRQPGFGRSNLDEVVVVPLPADRFVGTTVRVNEHTVLVAGLERRRPEEEPYVSVKAARPTQTWPLMMPGEAYIELPGPEGRAQKFAYTAPEPCKFAQAVLYRREVLVTSGEPLTDGGKYEWEVVSLSASAVEKEPMHPLTAVRNYLKKEGGTFMPLTLDELAESVWYWKDRVQLAPPEQ